MKNLLLKHKFKFIAIFVIKHILIVYFLFFASTASFASGTYSGIKFSDYEENATIYLCNYYSYQDFKNLYLNSRTAKNIINGRVDHLYTSVSDIDNISGISKKRLHYLKQQSHLIDWNKYTNDLGMTLTQTNFTYALSGALMGFIFMLVMIYGVM